MDAHYWNTVSAVVVGICAFKIGSSLFDLLSIVLKVAGERLWAHLTRQ